MNYETRFSVVRWVSTALPVWLALTNYFTLQSYLLQVYRPTAEYVNAGWRIWYLTLLIGSLLAISVNLLLFRFKHIFGTPRALKGAIPFVVFFPIYITYSQNRVAFNGNNHSEFSYYPLFVVLIITLVFHIILFFYKKDNKPADLA